MNRKVCRHVIPALFLLSTMAGCATTPEHSFQAGDELRHTDLDVLFATEFPVSSMEEALAVAGQALAGGEINKALFFYVRALQFEPDNVKLLTHIGDIHMRRGDTVMAKRAFLIAREKDPEFAPALESIGLIYMDEGRNEDAVSELTLAISFDETRWRAHNALGVYEDKKGNHQAALAHYTIALQINGNAAHVLNNKGYSRFLAGDIDGAVEDLHRAAFDKGFDRAWGNLATVYASEGSYEDAVDAYREVMSDANAYNAAGKIAIQNGDLQQAYSLLSEAVSRSSTYFPEAVESLKKLRSAGVTGVPIQIAGIRGKSDSE